MNQMLRLVLGAIVLMVLPIMALPVMARDLRERPLNVDDLDGSQRGVISDWFRDAKTPNGTSCCNFADGYREGMPRASDGQVIFRSWRIAVDGVYWVSVLDPISLEPKTLSWDGPTIEHNPTGGAVVWLASDYSIGMRILKIRCFAIGSQG